MIKYSKIFNQRVTYIINMVLPFKFFIKYHTEIFYRIDSFYFHSHSTNFRKVARHWFIVWKTINYVFLLFIVSLLLMHQSYRLLNLTIISAINFIKSFPCKNSTVSSANSLTTSDPTDRCISFSKERKRAALKLSLVGLHIWYLPLLIFPHW